MRRRWQSVGIAFLLLAVLASACAPRAVERAVTQSLASFGEGAAPPLEPARESRAGTSAAYDSADETSGAGQTRMIIRRADVSVVVADTDQTVTALRNIVAAHEGYIADSNRWISDEQPYARLTLRVPAEDLDQTLDEIRALAITVQNENVSGEDVTEEHVDLGARLRNLMATETELLALLTEIRENRGKAEEILAVHRELTEIRGQIESLQGRKQYLERMTAMATIQVEIRPKEAPRSVVERARWSPIVTGSKALRAFVRVFQVLIDLVIYLLIFSPFVLVPLVVLWLIIRTIRRRKSQRGVPSAGKGK